MSAKDNGGPAFPVSVANRTEQNVMVLGHLIPPNSESTFLGLSARDYFAGQALVGILASPLPIQLANGEPPSKHEHFAGLAYALADAMLKARQQ